MSPTAIDVFVRTKVPPEYRPIAARVRKIMQPLAGLFAGTMATIFAVQYGAENGAPLAVLAGGIVLAIMTHA